MKYIKGIINKFLKENEKELFEKDKADWQYDSCAKEYCKIYNKSLEELNKEDNQYIWECSGLLISYFITWLIFNDFLSDENKNDFVEEIKKVKEKTLKPTKFFECIDYKLIREDISDKIIDFVDEYYNKGFYSDYPKYMEKNNKNIFCTEFSWDDYENIEKIINSAYEKYKKGK